MWQCEHPSVGMNAGAPGGQERPHPDPLELVTGGCEQPDVGAGN